MPGRVRPALVTVQQARDVIASAQGLRKSDNRYVREHVYINPDLTKAQAAAAYQSMATGRATHTNGDNTRQNQSLTRKDCDSSASTCNHPSDSRLEPSALEFIPNVDKM